MYFLVRPEKILYKSKFLTLETGVDETLRLVPDILLPGYIKAWIPTIVFNTSDMTKLNGKSGKKRKKSLVFTNKISPRRTYLLPVVALRIANQDFCARLVISRIAQDTGRL